MANAFTNMNYTILSREIFNAFLGKIAPFNLFSRNVGPDAAQRGNKVRVDFVPLQDEALTFAGTYTTQDADATGVDVTLDVHRFVSLGITDTERANNPTLSIEMFAEAKANALAKAVLQNVFGLVTVANYAEEVEVAPGNFDSDDVIDLREDCAILNWPDTMRNLILDPAYMTGILKDTDVKAAYAYGDSNPVQGGFVPRLAGFGLYESTYIPTNSQGLKGMAVHPNAMAVGMRYLDPGRAHNYFEAYPITDEATGITLGFRRWYDNDTGTEKAVMECLFGKSVLDNKGIVRIQDPT
jgi:hypothetical protein